MLFVEKTRFGLDGSPALSAFILLIILVYKVDFVKGQLPEVHQAAAVSGYTGI
jgi:hypothetical protein